LLMTSHCYASKRHLLMRKSYTLRDKLLLIFFHFRSLFHTISITSHVNHQ